MSYCELHTHSHFSLTDGASSVEDLVDCALALEMPALALTDHDAVYGAVPFFLRAKANKLHPILGAEVTLNSGHHLTLLVKNLLGWQNLNYLLTQAQAETPKGTAALNPKRPTWAYRWTDCLIGLSQRTTSASSQTRFSSTSL